MENLIFFLVTFDDLVALLIFNDNFLTCNSMLCSKLIALGRPSRDEKATLPSRNGEMSLYSLVHSARDSSSPFLTDKKSGRP